MNQQESRFCPGCMLLSFIAGGLVGAGVVLLTAPKTGEETRKMIRGLAEDAKEKMEGCIDQVKDMASTYFEEGKDFIEKEKSIITKTVEAGKEAYEKEKRS
jgi:gas vesicle protein